MNFEAALQLRNDYQFLVGKKSKYVNHAISKILILPSDNEKAVMERIVAQPSLSSVDIVKSFKAQSYSVVVVFEIEGKYTFQDISLYLDQKAEN